MKKKVAKLAIKRETVRTLINGKLAAVVGGMTSITNDEDAGCIPTLQNAPDR